MTSQIHNMDCLEFMADTPDDSFDLTITSPPYEDVRSYGIDFRLKGDEWVEWSVKRFVECVRITRGLVAWVVEGKTRQFRWSATPATVDGRTAPAWCQTAKATRIPSRWHPRQRWP